MKQNPEPVTTSTDLLKKDTEPRKDAFDTPIAESTTEVEIRRLEATAGGVVRTGLTANSLTYVNLALTPKQVSYLVGILQSHITGTAEEIMVKLQSARGL